MSDTPPTRTQLGEALDMLRDRMDSFYGYEFAAHANLYPTAADDRLYCLLQLSEQVQAVSLLLSRVPELG